MVPCALPLALCLACLRAGAAAPADAGLDGTSGTGTGDVAAERSVFHPPNYGPPPLTPSGVPTDAELEAAHAVFGQVLIDNQNIFNVNDPADDKPFFRFANHLHRKTQPGVIRRQLLFRPGDAYSRRVLDESERILRADGYFYDAWIRPVAYHDGVVDVRVTTRDVWTLNPGFNVSRSGGSTSTGAQIEDLSILGSGIRVVASHSHTIDRTSNGLEVSDMHAFGGRSIVSATYAQNSDGYLRELTVQHPFYALDGTWAAGLSGVHDLQTTSLWDLGQIIDQFQDKHQGAQIFGGWSKGLQDGWARRFSIGVTYDEHLFSPLASWTGVTAIPADRRFLYPWFEFDLLEDNYMRMWNHDQIARTEDFYLGTSLTMQAGVASASLGSTESALLLKSKATHGFRTEDGARTLLLSSDFSGRIHGGTLQDGVLDAAVRYYVEQSRRWLFFTTVSATQGWNLDLDNQILLGGDNGLRGYPLRYQAGTGRALLTLEQRYFTDWYVLRLLRVGGAVFFDSGRTWGSAPLAEPSLGWLKDGGFGLRLGNSRSGLGNVVHVDVAFPFNGGTTISKTQFLIQTEQTF